MGTVRETQRRFDVPETDSGRRIHARFVRLGSLGVALLVLWACEQSVSDGASYVHPTQDNLPEASELADQIRMRGPANGADELHVRAGQFRAATEVLKLGVLEGPRHMVFGKVEDVDVDAQGRFAVLDSRFNEVRVYGPDGAVRESFGGPGRGPNEFMAPEALARGDTGTLIIADRNNQLKLFQRLDGRIVQKSTIQLEFAPEDFCVLGDRVYVQGFRPERGMVHVFSMAGEPLHSFGEPYRSENPLVRGQLSDGYRTPGEVWKVRRGRGWP